MYIKYVKTQLDPCHRQISKIVSNKREIADTTFSMQHTQLVIKAQRIQRRM